MKVGILYLPKLHIGGVESRILSLVNKSAKKNIEWVIIASVSEEFKGNLSPNISCIEVGDLNKIWRFQAWVQLKETLLSEKIDLLHIHSPSAAIPGRVAAWLARIPTIYTLHLPAASFFSSQPSFIGSLRKFFYTAIDYILNHTLTSRVVFVSRREYQNAIRKKLVPQKRSRVIQNGIDLQSFSNFSGGAAMNLRGDIKANTVLISFVGRLEYQKGIDILLDAIPHMQTSREKYAFWIIGDGSLREELIAKAQEQGFSDKMHFLGTQANIPELLSISDVFVLPSRFEAMSISVLEALAAGLPCIVTDTGDNSSLVIHNKNGLVISTEDNQALAQALDSMISNPDKRRKMGAASKQRSAGFSDESMAGQITDLYREGPNGS